MMAAVARFPHTASRRSVSVLVVPRCENHTCLVLVWFSHLGTTRTETLRRLAVWGNLATAAIIAAAPYISPRPVSERPLYEATAAIIGCFGLLLVLGRRWPSWLVQVLAIL